MTNSEINEAVARKLGYVLNKPWGWAHPDKPDKGFSQSMRELPDYFGSIAAAWEIVESVKVFYLTNRMGRWAVSIEDGIKVLAQAEADTAPLAICLAFLKLEDK